MHLDSWADIDAQIVQRLPVQAIILICSKLKVDMPEAQRILYERYKHLRVASPTAFICFDEDYWGGYYS